MVLVFARWDVTDHVSPKMVKELSAAHIVITQIACGDGHTLCLTNTGKKLSALILVQ